LSRNQQARTQRRVLVRFHALCFSR
jgi:hypothetical protein